MRKLEKQKRDKICVVSDHAISRYKETYYYLCKEPISTIKGLMLSHLRKTSRCHPCVGGGIVYRTNKLKFVTVGNTIVTVIHHTRMKDDD